jgi:hypothetical protein
MSDPSAIVECDLHGESYATFVCRHLAFGVNRGFYCADDDNDLRPDAWCMKCDELLMANGGEWNDEIEEYAEITLLCAHCYDRAKETNLVFRQGLEEQGWEVVIVAARLSDFPDIQPLSSEKLLKLKVGDTVKLIFDILGEDENGEFIKGEWMWVSLDEKTTQGYRGTLNNEPITDGSLHCGETIEFEDKHILKIYDPEAYVSENESGIRRVERKKIQ